MLLAHVVLDLNEEQRRSKEDSCLRGDFPLVQGVLHLAVHSKQGALAKSEEMPAMAHGIAFGMGRISIRVGSCEECCTVCCIQDGQRWACATTALHVAPTQHTMLTSSRLKGQDRHFALLPVCPMHFCCWC